GVRHRYEPEPHPYRDRPYRQGERDEDACPLVGRQGGGLCPLTTRVWEMLLSCLRFRNRQPDRGEDGEKALVRAAWQPATPRLPTVNQRPDLLPGGRRDDVRAEVRR